MCSKQVNNKNHMHVVYASDDNFAEIMGISIVSLFRNNKKENIHLYILDSGISQLNKTKIESVCKSFNQVLPVWIAGKDISQELGIDVQLDRGSLSQYARLFVSTLLPSNLERVLYLDCDIVIDKSLEELWNLDLNGKTIAALSDAFSKHYRANIGLNPEDIMFNSGVMLIDLSMWKKNRVEHRLMEFIKKYNGMVQQGDQGALNAVLSHETYAIEPRFNSVTIFHDFSYREMMIYRKPPSFYSENQVNQAINEPVIIHYTTSFLSRRPWVEGCEHKHKDTWLKYKELSPWKEEPLRKHNTRQARRMALSIYNCLPKNLSVRLAGCLQAYGRPMVNKIKIKKMEKFL